MSNSKVKVAVRVRPRNEREEGLNSECVVRVSDNQITLLPPSSNKERERKEPHSFTFDNCFWTEDKHDPGQEDVFRHLGDGVLENIWLGYNVCIFAYGQTGSGKTFSMMGTDDQPGIVPRICSALFNKEPSDSETFRIEASYLEIYNEEVRDLLRSAKKQKKLRVREDKLLGPYVEDLSCHAVQSYEEIKLLLDQGNNQRAIAETKMNEQSSRSHAILTLTVAQTCNDSKSGAFRELVSKVSLVDLAGSERSHKSGAQGSQLKESSNINKSLSTLGLVINSLAEISEKKRKSQYVNFRDSVLTWLLKNNLGGNSKTVMLATVSPAADNYQETLSTLRYADSAKRIVNQAVVNEDVKSKAIEELQQAIKRLREQLTTTEQEKEAKVQKLKSQLEEKENLLKDLKTSWEEKLKRTEVATQEWQKNLENMGVSLNTQDVVFSNDSYLIQQDKQLIVHNINATTKIGFGPSQDIQISGAEAECEHCVMRKTEDGEVFLIPVDNCQTYVNSCLSKTMTQLWHEDKIQIGSKKFSLHLPNSPKPEHMKSNDSTEAEAQTYDALNTEDDELSILPKRDSWNSSMIEDEKAKTDSAISTNYTTTEGLIQTISSSNDDFSSSKNKKISNISTQICNESYSYLINMNVNTARNTQSEYLGIAAGTQVQDSTVQCSPQYGEASSQTSESLKGSNCPKPEHMKTHDSTEAEAQTYDDLNKEDDMLSILSKRDSWNSSMIEDEKAKMDSATKYMTTEGLIQTIPSSNDDFSSSKNNQISHISTQICNESSSHFININVNTARNTQSEYPGIVAGTQVQDSTLQCPPRYGDVTFSNQCYPIHMIKATTKIGSGPSQDIQISGAEAEHCVIRKTEDGEVFLTPLDNSQTYVNSQKPEQMKTDDSTEAEAQTYDALNKEEDKLSILPKRDSWNSSMIEDGKTKTESAISTNYVTTEGLIQTIPSSNDDVSSSKNKQISNISTQICNEPYRHLFNMNVNTARNTHSEYMGNVAGTQVQDSTVQCSPRYGDVTFSNQCYLVQKDKQLIIHNIKATTKIGSGPSQDIQISGAEAEHCVIRKTEDGEVFLIPVDNCQTYVNSCLSKTMTQLWHGDKIQIGTNLFILHLPNSPKPEHMQSNDSIEAEAQTYDALNKDDDMLSILSKRDSLNSSMIEDGKAKMDSAISTNYTTEGLIQTIPSSNGDFSASKNKQISHISTQICNEPYRHLVNMNVNTARNTQSEYLGKVAGAQVQDSTVQCSPQYGEASSQTSESLKSSNCFQNTSDLEHHATSPSDGGRRCSQGFFCWDKDTDLKWLTDLLPRTSISNASVCCVSHPPEDYWKSDVQKFSPIILCHSFTKQVEWTQLEEFLTHCTDTCGLRVIVVMANVMDGDLETVREDWRKWKFSGCDLIILTCQEINSISTNNLSNSLRRAETEKTKTLKEILQTSTERIPVSWPWQTLQVKKAEVGIFSRSDESDYSWLVELLRSADFSDRVRSVTPCYISNSGRQKFRGDVSQCTFGILYHTKNRGRINITDVTDSLYDEELRYLHDMLGKDNVIVVIDDVEDDSYREKCWILKKQPSIQALARDLFLFSHNEKMPKFDLQHKSNLERKMALLKSKIS